MTLPLAPADDAPRTARELTLRGLLLGVAITALFTAANVYLGLKVGLTFASSIPAAVISMAVLRAFKGATIYENNIVQTVASAAGTLSSIIFVLPGLVMVGWWTGFPFWASFGVCAVGGILGVMYTVPLRRALVTESDLPYPEGVAAAEVLRVGSLGRSEGESRAGLAGLAAAGLTAALAAAAVAAGVLADGVSVFFRPTARTATGLGGSMSLALFGVGHLVGPAVGLAMAAGLAIAWGVATPWLVALHGAAGPAADAAQAVWKSQVRLIGAGAIGAVALSTVGALAAPVARGLASALRASRTMARGEGSLLPRQERDLPLPLVGLAAFACLPPLAALLAAFLQGTPLQPLTLPLVAAALAYIVTAGLVVAAVCGYMAGLIGSSNSPVSGLAILAALGGAALMLAVARGAAGGPGAPAVIAFTLFVTAALVNVATIANDNLQDLKTGQLVGATPWRQQAALVVGVLAGAAVIPGVLNLMNRAFGFAGVAGRALSASALPAPQATLISTLVKGLVGGVLDWRLLGVGGGLGVVLVVADLALKRGRRGLSLPPLAVALAIYLPFTVSTPVIAGSLIGWLYHRRAARRGGEAGEARRRLGVLTASGLIVGESLFQVAYAALVVVTGKGEPLALAGRAFAPAAAWLSLAVFFAAPLALYRVVEGWAERASAS